jgi:Fur family ferric uptake transcriptional regulator
MVGDRAARKRKGRSATETLRQKGFRMTPQRRLVLEAVEGSEGHLSAEDIYEQVRARYPRFHISTVYRNLELLKEQGLITETDLGQGHLSYHYQEKGHHHHLICEKCGAVVEMDESLLIPLREALLRYHGFRADLRHLAIFGRCDHC